MVTMRRLALLELIWEQRLHLGEVCLRQKRREREAGARVEWWQRKQQSKRVK